MSMSANSYHRNEKKTGSSVIPQWLVGPFMGTKQRMGSYIVSSNDPTSNETRLAPDFFYSGESSEQFQKKILKDHKF